MNEDLNSKILCVLKLVKGYPGKLSYTEFCLLTAEVGIFDAVRALGILAMRIVEEHNEQVEV